MKLENGEIIDFIPNRLIMLIVGVLILSWLWDRRRRSKEK